MKVELLEEVDNGLDNNGQNSNFGVTHVMGHVTKLPLV